MDMADIIKWIAGIGVTVLGWLYRGHENRLQSLESTREMKADADRQRRELREEVHEMGKDIGERLETIRIETNHTLGKLSDQITSLATSAASAARKRTK